MRENVNGVVMVMGTAVAIDLHLAERLYQHVGEDHDACCPEHHDALQQGQRQLVEGLLGDDEPEREEGDTEEMPEENIGLLDQSAEKTHGPAGHSYLKVTEAASLESTQILVWFCPGEASSVSCWESGRNGGEECKTNL